MPNVFINYRTGDEETVAGLLEVELSQRFDSKVFFRASKSISYGDDFEKALIEAVQRSDVLLAVIGPRWLDMRDNGHRKIDQESDWTRREIIEAFRCGVRVIPVLIGPVRPLTKDDLPNELANLAVCQYARLDHRDLAADLDRLAAELAQLVPGLRERMSTPPPGSVTNYATGNAQIGVQGVVRDISFGNNNPWRNN